MDYKKLIVPLLIGLGITLASCGIGYGNVMVGSLGFGMIIGTIIFGALNI